MTRDKSRRRVGVPGSVVVRLVVHTPDLTPVRGATRNGRRTSGTPTYCPTVGAEGGGLRRFRGSRPTVWVRRSSTPVRPLLGVDHNYSGSGPPVRFFRSTVVPRPRSTGVQTPTTRWGRDVPVRSLGGVTGSVLVSPGTEDLWCFVNTLTRSQQTNCGWITGKER